MKEKRVILVICFSIALFLYFFSESLLRVATVSNVDESKLNIETILAELPASLRDAVKYKLEVARLKDDIATARSDEEKLQAILALTNILRDESQKSQLYAEILKKYPNHPLTLQAYIYFLLKKDSTHSISIRKYHHYIQGLPPIKQFNAWQSGLTKLKMLHVSEKQLLEFLNPLLSMKPLYKDFFILYETIADIAINLNDYKLADKARDIQDKCYDLPPIEEILREEMKKEKIKRKKKKKVKTKQKKK